MAKHSEWVKTVTPDIRKNMEACAHAAYINGRALRDDAILLYKATRYPRAAALAILAEEEFSKAFILRTCANQDRWDSNVFCALRTHAKKQGISEGMLIYVEWLKENIRRVMELNRSSLVPSQPCALPTKETWEEILGTTKSRFSKPVRDHFKQDALYVSLDAEARLKSIPDSVTQSDAERCLKDSEQFQLVTEVLLGDPNASEKFARL